MARRLRRLGLETVRDLLFHLPRRYDDFTRPRTLASLREDPPEEPVSAVVRIDSLDVSPTVRRRVQRTVARISDASGSGEAVWFGRRFIERRLKPGDTVVLSGKLQGAGKDQRVRAWPSFANPEFGLLGGEMLHAGRIVPVYRLTEGVSGPWLRRAVRGALDRFGTEYPEYLPEDLRQAVPEAGPGIAEALQQAHYPNDMAGRERALDRLAFDELLALQLGMVARDRQRRGLHGIPVLVPEERWQAALSSIEATLTERVRARLRAAAGDDPARRAEADAFRAELTPDQRAAAEAIRRDLEGPRPMLRLLQGDVGSGKTAVAALALAVVADAGNQGALLAPTDLLARQHRETLRTFLEPLGHEVTLLTASLPGAERRAALELASSPPSDPTLGSSAGRVFVGTHALLQQSVDFARLGLAIVDEQHRFGVAQREALSAKGDFPHVLLMTATPIPQTLGRVLHADLDVSDLRTPPKGRTPIGTGVRPSAALLPATQGAKSVYGLLLREIAAGRRGFVVVPLVAEDEASAARSAEVTAEQLRATLPAIVTPEQGDPVAVRVGLVHGQMPARLRDEEMERFRRGEVNVLVGTTVIEVGVDVPEATVMVILDADRFGVAQLHQLRGRVGRGEALSYCALVSDSDDATARARLEALANEQDGFALAELDLELRGEGELLGLTQSGLPPLRVARLGSQDHQRLSVVARQHAERLVDQGGGLGAIDEALRTELTRGWLRRVGAGEAIQAAGDEPRSADG
ncbi:MAG TPA: ATP-dependent DNA helicase RecG [Candidatus Limnocylindrales bacterium]|nr:ATP-dependent DNA helicase RecG [Candidatus Limnocylindrales bacterium]